MTRSRLLVGTMLAVLLAAGVAGGIWLGRDGPLRPDQPGLAGAQETPEAPGTVVVSREAQERSGLVTQAIVPATFHPSAVAYAAVVDVQPLLALHTRIASGEAGVRSAQAAAMSSQQELERNRVLYADDRNVSRKAVQQSEAAFRASEARLESAQGDLREARATAAQQFGPTLASWAGVTSSPELDSLASRKRVLVSVALPDAVAGSAPRTIRLEAPGYSRATAKLVSPSPRLDPLSAGRTYLYLSDVAYPAGLALDAGVPLAGHAIEGFRVPESAVIWYGNEAWVFVEQGADRFVRRALREPRSTEGGIFTTTAFAQGERIVTTGAELLHSEELRPKTTAAAGCSDPECDD